MSSTTLLILLGILTILSFATYLWADVFTGRVFRAQETIAGASIFVTCISVIALFVLLLVALDNHDDQQEDLAARAAVKAEKRLYQETGTYTDSVTDLVPYLSRAERQLVADNGVSLHLGSVTDTVEVGPSRAQTGDPVNVLLKPSPAR